MMTLKAIDTAYKGYLFRSRLEARWAVFFDALNLKWEYEVEGFDLDGVWYLPDFEVARSDGSTLWVEIKPFRHDDDQKFSAFARTLRAPDKAVLFDGTPYEYAEHWGPHYLQDALRLLPPVTRGLARGLPGVSEKRLHTMIEKAAQVAQRARFEHGACG
jgi:hypothetical protein